MASSSSSYSTFDPPSAHAFDPETSTLRDRESLNMSEHSQYRSPHLTKFLSDFTLGFSDGLTVPFALTAGLSSLGSADTVIYAGLAELCAGSISMGIGGYLAALDELPCPPPSDEKPSSKENEIGDEDERAGMLVGADGATRRRSSVGEKGQETEEGRIRRHLEPLSLPEETTAAILANLRIQPGGVSRAALRLQDHSSSILESTSIPISPISSGLSISLGYVIGGIIPLLPYFFAPTVGMGLRWSIGMCLLALYLFGAGKSWILRREGSTWRRCVFEGVQMLVLGSLAAGAAILCVRLLESGSGPGGD